MINNNILFVLGAGSSVEYGYPTGNQLVQHIIDNLNNHIDSLRKETLDNNYRKTVENTIYDKKYFNDLLNQSEGFVNALKEARPKTIDSFLARQQPKYDVIGKFAISLSILNAEWRSGKDNFPSYHDSKDNWQKYLFDKICDKYNNPDTSLIQSPNIGIITFNYDRSLECSFYRYLRSHYRISKQEDVKRILNPIHAYGCIREGLNYNEYGKAYTIEEVQKNADTLEIMYENRGTIASKISDYEQWLLKFNKIYFLGFAYDYFNIKNINLTSFFQRKKGHVVYGTIKNMNEDEIQDIKIFFGNNNVKATLLNSECLLFLRSNRI